jgi:ABC-type nitrate/sulfonate/bicarbonate transport system substrate-binding protein
MRKKRAFILLTALIATGALAVAGCGGSSEAKNGRNSNPTLKVAYFQGAVAGPDAVVAANPQLAGAVGAKIELHPIDSGVTGISQLKAGAFPVISGVGNPPFVGAIANGIDVTAVFVESLDQAGLVVSNKIKSNTDLVGTKVGVLVGSTLDFEFKGWLTSQGLEGKVEAASFASEAAEAAAWKAGKIDAVYISQAFLQELKKHGGRVVVDAAEIAKLGYAATNLLAISTPYIKQHPDLVQKLVCQISKAQELVTGPDAATYITPAAKFLGVAPADAIEGTKGYPYVATADEAAWLKGPDGTSKSGKLAQNFNLTGKFLVAQGRAKTPPADDVIAAHIDPTFWNKAQAGGCA